MRIRSTKPEFWRSSTVASVDWDARLVLKGLESYVDDNGVGKDDIALIVGDVFSRDMVANPRDTLARVSEAITHLSEAGLLHRYTANGKPLVYISNWDSLQRIDKPGKGRLPRPDGTMDYKESIIRESVASPREGVAPGTEEQGNRGTEEQGNLCPPPAGDRFDDFWTAYPRKVGKSEARRKFAKALEMDPDLDPQVLVDAATRYANDPNRSEKFTRYPATWLHQGNWEDAESLFADDTSGSKTSDWDGV